MFVLKKTFDEMKRMLESVVNKAVDDKELIEEQNDGLAKLVTELKEQLLVAQCDLDRITKSKKSHLVEEVEILSQHIEMLNDIIDDYEKQPELQPCNNNKLLEAFEEQVDKLPASCSGVCTVKEDGEVKTVNIRSKTHAEELLQQFKDGELELVG